MIFRCLAHREARFYCSRLVREQDSLFFSIFEKSRKMDAKREPKRPKNHLFWGPNRALGAHGSIDCAIRGLLVGCQKNMFFWSAKNRLKKIKNRPRGAQGPILAQRPVAKHTIFGQEVPGAASRARTSKQIIDRGAIGAGSDTPWAKGPANLYGKTL